MGFYLGGTLVTPIITNTLPGQFNWMGTNAQRILENFYTKSTTLDKTSFNGWTPSTTAKAIIATATATTFTADMANYDYILEWKWDNHIAYNDSYTSKVHAVDRQYGALYQCIHRRPYGFDAFEDKDYYYAYCTTLFTSSSYCLYWNGSSNHTWTSGISYGFYAGANNATFSSNSADNPTVTIKTPTINARCYTSYFTTGSAAEVDQANSTVKFTGNLYRVDIGTSAIRNIYATAVNMYDNPLQLRC